MTLHDTRELPTPRTQAELEELVQDELSDAFGNCAYEVLYYARANHAEVFVCPGEGGGLPVANMVGSCTSAQFLAVARALRLLEIGVGT